MLKMTVLPVILWNKNGIFFSSQNQKYEGTRMKGGRKSCFRKEFNLIFLSLVAFTASAVGFINLFVELNLDFVCVVLTAQLQFEVTGNFRHVFASSILRERKRLRLEVSL